MALFGLQFSAASLDQNRPLKWTAVMLSMQHESLQGNNWPAVMDPFFVSLPSNLNKNKHTKDPVLAKLTGLRTAWRSRTVFRLFECTGTPDMVDPGPVGARQTFGAIPVNVMVTVMRDLIDCTECSLWVAFRQTQ